MMFKMQIYFFIILLAMILPMGNCTKVPYMQMDKIPEIQGPVDGISIAWDFRSLKKIAPLDERSGYFGYARMAQLWDGRLACVYETSAGNVELVFSIDMGDSWSNKQVIFESKNNIAMAVPEIIELNDHSVLIACNPRPRVPYSEDRRFGILVRKSNDGCQSWEKEQVIYQAQSTFNNGCWEPSMVQLPSGEIQLFFANEGIYTDSDEQNISMFKSADFGNSWSAEPQIIGFRQNRRDGMPVPLLLKEKGELLIAIEDNKKDQFKPTVYREKLSDNWSGGTISALDPRREYAPQADPLAESIYAGAPYLERLSSGEVILSYQSTWLRDILWDRSSMVVEIGNTNGSLFNRRSIPFKVPLSKHGLWNSLCVINGLTPVALTSTNTYSATSTEVWMIKGKVIPEFNIPQATCITDGLTDDDCWQHEWPYFIGHNSRTQLLASICKDEQNLYVAVKINEPSSATVNKKGEEFSFYLDSERKGYKAPHKGIFAFRFKSDGTTLIQQGENGQWISDTSGIKIKAGQILKESLHMVELAIPLALFPKDFGQNKTIGINFCLQSSMPESITGVNESQPFSWMRAYLPE